MLRFWRRDHLVTHEMASSDEFQELLQKFDSDGRRLVDEAILPGCSIEVGNDGRMLKLHIHNDSVNSLHDPMRNHEDCAAADLLLASTPEERASVVDTLMWNLVQPPHEIPTTTDDRHVRYKPEDAISLVAKVPTVLGQYIKLGKTQCSNTTY